MSRRLTIITVIALMILLSLTLAACEKERPVPTPSRSRPNCPRHRGRHHGYAVHAIRGADESDCPRGGRHPDCASDADSGRWGHVDDSHRPAAGGGQHRRRERDRPVFHLYRCRRGHPGGDCQPVQHDPEGIVQLNGLKDANVLALGQQLKIPGKASSAGTGATSGAGTTGTGGPPARTLCRPATPWARLHYATARRWPHC